MQKRCIDTETMHCSIVAENTKPVRVPVALLAECDELIENGYRGVRSHPEIVRDALRLYLDTAAQRTPPRHQRSKARRASA